MATEISKLTRERVWREMFNAERYVQYYSMLTNRFTLRHRIVRFVLVVGASIAVVSTLPEVPWGVGLLGAVVLVGVTTFDFIWDYGTRAALAHAISLECNVIQKDYERLWWSLERKRIEEQDCQEQLSQLTMRTIAAGALLTDTDTKLNEKAQDKAFKVLSNRGVKHVGREATT